jgi:hypothetical protein
MVLNIDGRRFQASRPGDDQLPERFEASQHAQRIRSRQPRLLLRNFEVVALVFTQALHPLGRVLALDDQGCRRPWRSDLANSANRLLQARLRVPGKFDTQLRADREASLPQFHLGRPRH